MELLSLHNVYLKRLLSEILNITSSRHCIWMPSAFSIDFPVLFSEFQMPITFLEMAKTQNVGICFLNWYESGLALVKHHFLYSNS